MGRISEQAVVAVPSFIHDTALIYGKVSIGKSSSVFAYTVARAEVHEIKIGERSNIQEHVVIQVGDFTCTDIGDDCSICTRCTLRGCEIGNGSLVGINSTIMDGAKIGERSIIAAHSFVDKNAIFERNSIIAGVPAKKIATRDNTEITLLNSKLHQLLGNNYSNEIERLTETQLAAIMTALELKG